MRSMMHANEHCQTFDAQTRRISVPSRRRRACNAAAIAISGTQARSYQRQFLRRTGVRHIDLYRHFRPVMQDGDVRSETAQPRLHRHSFDRQAPSIVHCLGMIPMPRHERRRFYPSGVGNHLLRQYVRHRLKRAIASEVSLMCKMVADDAALLCDQPPAALRTATTARQTPRHLRDWHEPAVSH